MPPPSTVSTEPDFAAAAFLRGHILHTMAFYDGRCIDPAGSFFHFYKDDGRVYDHTTRHLVSSTRFVVTHAWAARRFVDHPRASAWWDAARHGLAFLRDVHRDPKTGGYAWQLRFASGRHEVIDAMNHCYGLAFVALAHAEALRAGIGEAREGLDETIALLERRFWEADAGLYADESSADWTLARYRGQNDNMHACEAMLAAYHATGEARHLPTPIYVEFMNSLGANAPAMPSTETYTALEQGAIDGMTNPLLNITDGKYNEVSKHLTITNHMYTPQAVRSSSRRPTACPRTSCSRSSSSCRRRSASR